MGLWRAESSPFRWPRAIVRSIADFRLHSENKTGTHSYRRRVARVGRVWNKEERIMQTALRLLDRDMMDKQRALDAALGQIERAFGKGSIMKLGSREAASDIDVISTGSLGLDIALGIGGLPRGRVVEIYGPESSGKTTLALHVIAEAQKTGGTSAFIDAEHALDLSHAERLGLNSAGLEVSQPHTGQEGAGMSGRLVRCGALERRGVESRP